MASKPGDWFAAVIASRSEQSMSHEPSEMSLVVVGTNTFAPAGATTLNAANRARAVEWTFSELGDMSSPLLLRRNGSKRLLALLSGAVHFYAHPPRRVQATRPPDRTIPQGRGPGLPVLDSADMKRFVQTRSAALLLVLVALALSAGAQAQVNLAPLPLEPPTTGGVTVVERALAKLTTHKRLLVIAAHPDDEDTALLTLVARGQGGESAYLSLSRGEGGQNLIGPELGIGLGLLRTRELLAARQVDGGRQFFTRAYDFGYTRSLDETLRLWPREVLVEDAVRVIRRFKPQVVVSIFPGVPHPNHGQHQAAGVTAHEAFPLAGDPDALPQLRKEGLLPWTPQVLFRSGFRDTTASAIPVSVAGVDPLAGKSLYQIASASR